MLEYTGATPQPLVRAGTPTLTPTTGDGDAYLEPGETATLALPVTNVGDGTATGISVTVDDRRPAGGADPAQPQSYGDLAAGRDHRRGTSRLALRGRATRSASASRSRVRVTFAGVLSPTTGDVHACPTGQPATTRDDFAYSGPAVPIPDNSTAGATVTIPVTGVGYASKLTFSVDGTTCTTTAGVDDGRHRPHLRRRPGGTLTAPRRHKRELFPRNGRERQQPVPGRVRRRRGDAVRDGARGDGAVHRHVGPIEPLAPLLDASTDGDWTFKVTDGAAADTGTIRAVSLSS